MVFSTVKAAASLIVASTLVAGRPSTRQVDIDAFIQTETPIALQGILNNIGPDGSLVQGASAGIVVASPSNVDPDCE